MIKLNNTNNINNNAKGEEVIMNLLNRFETQKNEYMVPLYTGVGRINKDMIENTKRPIDCDQLSNKSKALAVMSYSFGSLVGVTTTGTSLGLSVLSNVDQFFDGEKLVLNKARKVFKEMSKNHKKGYKYQPVFNKVNKISVVNKFGAVVEMIRVSVHEVREFDERIKRIDSTCCTKEDMKIIAKDLDIIGRALQELAIDVTKDKSKDIGYNINNFIQTGTKTHSRVIANGDFTNNIKEVIDNHFNRVATPDYKISANFLKLANANIDSKSDMGAAVVEDIAGQMMEAINDGYTDTMGNLCDQFKLANNKMYARYFTLIDIAKNAKDENSKKIAHMIRCSIIAMNTITSLYSLRENNAAINGAYINEIAERLRNGLYTEAKRIGVSAANQVVKFAIAGAFCKLKAGKITLKAKASFTQLWAMFSKEFIIEYLAMSGEAEIKDMLTVKYNNFDICLGQELEFVDGMAEVEDTGCVVVAENYTGKAVVTEDGIEAKVNHYAYVPTPVLFLNNIYDSKPIDVSNNTAYERPEKFITRESFKEEDYKMFNQSLSKRVHSVKCMKITGQNNIYDLMLQHENKVFFVGTVMNPFTNKAMMPGHALITNGYGGVVFVRAIAQ